MRPQRLEAYIRLALCIPPLLLCAPGCASQEWRKHVLYSRDGVVLYAEHRENETGPVPQGFLHPVDVPPETMDAILAQIVYKHRPLFGENQDLLLFEKQDVEALSEPVRLALGALTPDQRLRFLLVRDTWASMFTGPKATSGVMFVRQEGVLNLAIDRIRESVTIVEGGAPSDVSFPYEPTEYREGDDPLIPFGGATLHVDTRLKRRFPRWLEVQLAAVKPAPEPRAPERTAPPAVASPGAVTAAGAGAAATASASSSGAVEDGSPAAAAEAPEKTGDERYTDLKEKLETLKRLKEDGVLTEEQYKQQFDKIMSEL